MKVFYLRNIIYLAKITRALLSKKLEFCIFEKVNNSIATRPCKILPENRTIFFEFFSAIHNSMTKWCSALFKHEKKENCLRKLMHNFLVH